MQSVVYVGSDCTGVFWTSGIRPPTYTISNSLEIKVLYWKFTTIVNLHFFINDISEFYITVGFVSYIS